MNTGKEGDVSSYPNLKLWKMTFPKENPQQDKFDAVPFESRNILYAITSVLESGLMLLVLVKQQLLFK